MAVPEGGHADAGAGAGTSVTQDKNAGKVTRTFLIASFVMFVVGLWPDVTLLASIRCTATPGSVGTRW